MSDKNTIVNISASSQQSNAPLPLLVDESRKLAKELLHQQLCNMLETADDTLFDMAEGQYDKARFDAMRLLRLKKELLLRTFTQSFDREFGKHLSRPDKAGSSASIAALSFEEFSLVQDDVLEEDLALDALVAKARRGNGQLLEQIRIRVDALMPSLRVEKANNPFEPANMFVAFREAVDALDMDIETVLIIFKLFERCVGNNFGALLEQINQFFVDRGVLPELKLQHAPPAAARSGERLGTVPSSDDSSTAPAQGSDAPNFDTLISLLGQVNSDAVGQQSAQAGEVTKPQLLHALSQIQSRRSSQSLPLGEQLKNQLQNQLAEVAPSSNVAQVDQHLIDIVSMLFDFILGDDNLRPEIKSEIAKLQIPMLKVGLLDKQFFSSKKHPARQLLNELAYLGLAWDEKDPQAEITLNKIKSCVTTICNDFEDDLELFSELLKDFIAFKQSLQKRAEVLERRVREAEEGKAKTQNAKSRVNHVLNKVIEGNLIPDIIKSIFKEVWAHVMFLEALKGEQGEWEHTCQFAKLLVWSVQPKEDEHELAKLKKAIPKLVKNLKIGFSKISYSPLKAATLLEKLELEHRRVIADAQQLIEQAQSEPDLIRLKPQDLLEGEETQAQQQPQDATEITEKQEVAIEEVAFSKEETGEGTILHEQQPVTAESMAAVEQLHAGSWYELRLDNEFRRCKLAAKIASTGRFIFVNRSGLKVAEFTREQLAYEYQIGNVKVLDDDALFDRALQAVIANLREMKASA